MKPSLAIILGIALTVYLGAPAWASADEGAGELHLTLRSEPKSFNPMLVDEISGITIRYLTGGVLARVNRKTQKLEPELAVSWKESNGGRKITFQLREGVYFSDGTPFTSEDVAYTMRTLMDPKLHSPTGDSFRASDQPVVIETSGKYKVSILFAAPIAGMAALFDEVAIVSGSAKDKDKTVLGPFYVADYKPGSFVYLNRNNNYWKHDAHGKSLPYLKAIRLDIQQNRDIELLRFSRGEVDLIETLEPEQFDRLRQQDPAAARDTGPSLEGEEWWFNQVPTAPIPEYKKAWFRSPNFRGAISHAINRDDIARVVFHGHAAAASGPFSPANVFWFNQSLRPPAFDQKAALAMLQQDGFRMDNGVLHDHDGNAVEFSVITNAGNKPRERMAALMQQDLLGIGIRLNLVTLDFPSVIDRIARNYNYESCLLGLTNVDLDPNQEMNVWLSSAENHQWYPNEKTPATPWEAQIDKLMRAQASTLDAKQRKQYFDEVQQIVLDQAPFIYLVNKNSLSGISPAVRGADPAVLHPRTFWNIEYLSLDPEKIKNRK